MDSGLPGRLVAAVGSVPGGRSISRDGRGSQPSGCRGLCLVDHLSYSNGRGRRGWRGLRAVVGLVGEFLNLYRGVAEVFLAVHRGSRSICRGGRRSQSSGCMALWLVDRLSYNNGRLRAFVDLGTVPILSRGRCRCRGVAGTCRDVRLGIPHGGRWLLGAVASDARARRPLVSGLWTWLPERRLAGAACS